MNNLNNLNNLNIPGPGKSYTFVPGGPRPIIGHDGMLLDCTTLDTRVVLGLESESLTESHSFRLPGTQDGSSQGGQIIQGASHQNSMLQSPEQQVQQQQQHQQPQFQALSTQVQSSQPQPPVGIAHIIQQGTVINN